MGERLRNTTRRTASAPGAPQLGRSGDPQWYEDHDGGVVLLLTGIDDSGGQGQ
ncbi:hypothetical protein [Streptomyces albus]|uniref:hypothetical protein n=1 Tax=Streptomyces TaxID=1883 RepID=UPI000A4DF69C|nr:hypothetical protein [Streptomyces sp. NRRL F-5639]